MHSFLRSRHTTEPALSRHTQEHSEVNALPAGHPLLLHPVEQPQLTHVAWSLVICFSNVTCKRG